METNNQNIASFNNLFVGSKHRAKVLSVSTDHIVMELIENGLKVKISFSHLQFPDVWLSVLIYRKVDEVLPIKVMNISTDMEIFVVPTDILPSLAYIEDKSISLTAMETRLEQSIDFIKNKINKLNEEAESLTQKSLGIFRGIKELNGCCSKKLVRQLKLERSDILRQRKEVNNSTFELFINLRANEAELESLRNEIKNAKSKNKKLQHK